MLEEKGRAVSWHDVLLQWPLVEFTFQSVLGVDLEEVWNRKSWRWFSVRLSHLLSTDTPLARFFAPRDSVSEDRTSLEV